METNATEGIDVAGNATVVPSLNLDTVYWWNDSFHSFCKDRLIILRVASSLSAIGSTYIIFSMVVKHRRKNLDRTFDRLLLCLSVVDLISSVSVFFGPW